MENFKVIITSLLLVMVNIILGHYYGGIFGIMATPIVFITISILIGFFYMSPNSINRGIIIYLLTTLHFWGIVWFHGGTHDLEGKAWIYVSHLLSSILSYAILLLSFFVFEKKSLHEKLFVILLFPLFTTSNVLLL